MKVKICGITRVEDAMAAAEAGADAVGFVFVPSSPRYIDPEAAGCIVRNLPPFVTPVGVFVNESRAGIERAVGFSGVRVLQLHGEEPPAATEDFLLPVVKSFRVGEGFSAAVLAEYVVPAYLLDTYAPGIHGGTGKTFDWNIAVEAKRYGRIILSGGIHAGNVDEAVRRVGPYGIDVSSGVESVPGIKDPRKLTELLRAAREAEREGREREFRTRR
jgi:phosphoribosylanthranilate isomerase